MDVPAIERSQTGPAIRLGFNGRTVAIVVAIGLLLYLVVGPTLMLVFTSVKDTANRLPFESGTPFTLANFERLVLDPATYPVLATTAVFVVGSLAIGMAIAIPIAWLIERSDLPFRGAVFALIVGSTGIPSIISAIAWALLLNPVNGLVNLALRGMLGFTGTGPLNIYSVIGLFAIQGISIVPLSILLIGASFRSMDSSLEDAASASGARFRSVAWRVTLPLMLPAILGALVYQFVVVVESFDIPLILGLNSGVTVLSTAIYADVHPPLGLPNYGAAAAYGVLLLIVAMVPLVLFNRFTSRTERFATIGGRSSGHRVVRLGRWKWPVTALVWLFIFVAVILPFAVMVWTSLQPFYAVPSPESFARISLKAYATAASRPIVRAAFVNTAILGIATALATMAISLLVSWIIIRVRSRLTVIVDALAFMPHAMPGVIIGLTILLIYILLPLPVYGTIWIIVIALTTQYIALGTRLLNGAIVQIDRQLEEAGDAAGATWFQTIRRITLPLVFPAFVNGFLLVFLASIKNLTQALVLFSPGSVVVSTEIYDRWSFGDTSVSAAMGVVISAITVALAVFLRRSTAATAGVA